MFTWAIIAIEAVSAVALIFLVLLHSGRGGGISDLMGGSIGRRGDRFDGRGAQPRPHHDRRRAGLHLRHAGARPAPAVAQMPSRRRWRARCSWPWRRWRPLRPGRASPAPPASAPTRTPRTLVLVAARTLQRLLGTSRSQGRRRPPTRCSTSRSPRPSSPTQTARWSAKDGPIASAELTSLSPETVRYTHRAQPVLERRRGLHRRRTSWRGGSARGRWRASPVTGTERSSRSASSANGLTVTAVFATALRRLGPPLSRHGRGRRARRLRAVQPPRAPVARPLRRLERDAESRGAGDEPELAARSEPLRSRRHHRRAALSAERREPYARLHPGRQPRRPWSP